MALIAAHELSFAYSGGRPVLTDVSLTIDKGETVALAGDNGRGKTTLSKLLMGILQPQRGQVLIDGQPTTSLTLDRIGAKIGYLFQQPSRQLFTASVRDEIAFGLRYRGVAPEIVNERVDEALAYFGMTHIADSFPFNLSRGERQRLVIAAIMVGMPEFAILDEPTVGLDAVMRERLFALLGQLRQRGVGYLIISHDRELCRQCTERTLILENGRLR